MRGSTAVLRRVLLVGTTVLGLASGFVYSAATASGDATTTSQVTTTLAPPPTTTTVAPRPTTTTTVARRRHRVPILGLGSSGAAVLALQRRLAGLGYWLGAPNGVFGDSTQQAVYAFQKAASLQRDGVAGGATQAALARGVRARIRDASGNLVEVNLSRDLLMIIRNGKLFETLNTSTGGGYTYVSGGVSAVAITPVGVFHVYRQVDGLVTDALGQLWRPKYFDSGFAIHGDAYVPGVPYGSNGRKLCFAARAAVVESGRH